MCPVTHQAHQARETRQASIPDERLSVERRHDGVLVVRVRSAGPEHTRLPDAVFSFRCGDPQYAYWLRRVTEQSETPRRTTGG